MSEKSYSHHQLQAAPQALAPAPAQAGSCNAMMSLLDKYARIGLAMDQARQQSTEATTELQAIQQRIAACQAQRKQMSKQNKEAQNEIQHDWKDKLKEATVALEQVKETRTQAEREKEEAMKCQNVLVTVAKEQREEFLETCRTFQDFCRQQNHNRKSSLSLDWTDSAGTMSLGGSHDKDKHAKTPYKRNKNQEQELYNALANHNTHYTYEDDDLSEFSDQQETDNPLLSESEQKPGQAAIHFFLKLLRRKQRDRQRRRRKRKRTLQRQPTSHADTNSPKKNPLTRDAIQSSSNNSYDGLDQEMLHAKKRRRQAQRLHSRTKNSSKQIQTQLSKLHQKAKVRKDKLDQAQSQLWRVRKEVQQMEDELEKMQKDTVETSAMADAYAKDACRRKRTMTHQKKTSEPTDSNSQARPSTNPPKSKVQDPVVAKTQFPDEDQTRESKVNSHESALEAEPPTKSIAKETPPAQATSVHSQQSSRPQPRSNRSPSNNHENTVDNREAYQKTSRKQQVTMGESQALQLTTPLLSTSHSRTSHDNCDLSSSSAAASGWNVNPYKKRSLTGGGAVGGAFISSSSSSSTWGMDHEEPYSGERRVHGKTNTVATQHPHRVGRIRINRQFSTALEIVGEEQGEDANQQNETNREGKYPSSMVNGRVESEEEDDDDDDDDEHLLSYVAFRSMSQT